MTRMFILAVGLVIGMVFNAAPAMAQCPTDDKPCEWKRATSPIRVVLTLEGKSCWFDVVTCYRCCSSNGRYKMEIRLDRVERVAGLDCDEPWNYSDHRFWQQVDRAAVRYGIYYGVYADCSPTCDKLPKCKPYAPDSFEPYLISYTKQQCYHTAFDVNKGQVLMPCAGSIECVQEWSICCDEENRRHFTRRVIPQRGTYICQPSGTDECYGPCHDDESDIDMHD